MLRRRRRRRPRTRRDDPDVVCVWSAVIAAYRLGLANRAGRCNLMPKTSSAELLVSCSIDVNERDEWM